MSQNKIILLGNIGKPPEFITFPNGGSILKVSLATKEVWRDKANNELQKKTDWHNVVFKNKKAEAAHQYLRRGDKLYIEGRLSYNKWQDEKGSHHTTAEIIVLAFDTMTSNNSRPVPQVYAAPTQQHYDKQQKSSHMV
jgi:single-strand DNA-binding protein|tara:strand:- start:3399 stop:3812 length:414 start_codon:yes stop_codon:yes gene_type:complete